MAAIKGKDTKPEILVRKLLFSKGLRYRLNNRKLPGSPDIVLKKYKTVIFVDGCFWHGHKGCKYFTQKCPTNRNQLRSPKAPFDTQSVTTLTPSSFGGGNAPKFIFAVKLGLIRKMLQINAKEAFEVDIFRPPFCSTFCSTGKGDILPYFASCRKNKNSRFRLKIRSLQ